MPSLFNDNTLLHNYHDLLAATPWEKRAPIVRIIPLLMKMSFHQVMIYYSTMRSFHRY